MKRFIYFFLIVLIAASCNFIANKDAKKESNGNSIELSALDNNSVFNALFNPYVKEWCLWKPTSIDTAFPVSSDGLCHTKLEKVLQYREDTLDIAVLVFGTFSFDNGIAASSHSDAPFTSIAIFEKGLKGSWLLKRFEKNFGAHGSWGNLPPFKLGKLGRQQFLIEERGYTNQGITVGGETYYHIPTLRESLNISFMNEGGTLKEENEQENWEEQIKDISEGSTTKVIVISKGQKDKDGKGIIKFENSIEYILNDSCIFRPVAK